MFYITYTCIVSVWFGCICHVTFTVSRVTSPHLTTPLLWTHDTVKCPSIPTKNRICNIQYSKYNKNNLSIILIKLKCSIHLYFKFSSYRPALNIATIFFMVLANTLGAAFSFYFFLFFEYFSGFFSNDLFQLQLFLWWLLFWLLQFLLRQRLLFLFQIWILVI